MFKDHFSVQANNYSRFRPDYPTALYERILEHCEARSAAWDCATGSGQAAQELANYFDQVVASDASHAQLLQASRADNILYTTALAEASGIASQSLDLVTVAQGLHWFDFERFGGEVQRVLKPGAVLAAWCYGLLEIAPSIDPIVRHFYTATVGAHWPPERSHVDTAYRDIHLALDSLSNCVLDINRQWTLDTLLGYITTWSACQRYRQNTGEDPVAILADQLSPVWGQADVARTVRWPIQLRLWRNGS